MANPRGLVQCPNCSKKMGKLAKYCTVCGAKLSVRLDADTIREMAEKQKEDLKYCGGTCNTEHHNLLRAIIALDREENGGISSYSYCPDCGKKLL